MTSGNSNLRGVVLKDYNIGIYAMSPGETNPDKDPFMRGINPKLELVGRFIQSNKVFKEDIFDDEKSALETIPKLWETKQENSERLMKFINTGFAKFKGDNGNWFIRRERFLISRHRVSTGQNIGRWMYAWNLKQAYELFAKEVVRIATILEKNGEYQSDFTLFSGY